MKKSLEFAALTTISMQNSYLLNAQQKRIAEKLAWYDVAKSRIDVVFVLFSCFDVFS